MWSRNYDRSLNDIFAIQSEIAQAISSNLELILTHAEKQTMINAPTSELRAYDLYLRGKYSTSVGYFVDREASEVRESLRYCQQAVELDPEFALAYTCLANSYLELGVSDFVAKDEWLPLAMSNVEKAIELDPDGWQAYDVLAKIHFSLGDTGNTRRYSQKVLELNPNQQDYLANEGLFLISEDRDIEKGMDMVLRSLELMPGSSISFDSERLVSALQWLAPDLAIELLGTHECRPDHGLVVLNTIASYSLVDRDYEMYRRCQERILEINNTPNNRINAGAASLFTGDFERARAHYEYVISQEKSPDESFTKYPYKHRYALTLIETGEQERGQAILDDYRRTLEASIESGQQLHGNKSAYYDLAAIYAVMGDKRKAVEMLRQAKDGASEGAFFDTTWLVGDTMLDSLRDFPPFLEFKKSLALDDDSSSAVFERKLAEFQAEGRLLWLTAE